MWLHDTEGTGNSYAAVVLNFKKFESAQVMKEYLQKQIEGLCKKIPNFYMRTRLVNVLGKWYFKYMEDEKEWAAMQDHLYVINDHHFKSREELESYVL